MAESFRYQMALENYLDNTGKDEELINEVWEKQAKVREAKFHEPEDKLVEMAKELLEEFKKVVEKVGKENFTFYEDGDLEYNWIKNGRK